MERIFSISTLKMICDVANTQNLSKSARSLNKRQANISRALMHFEAESGIQIFDRTVRPIIITPTGLQLMKYIYNHLKTYHELNEFIENYKKNTAGKVRIDAPSGQLLLIAKYVLPLLHKEHPDIRVDLFTSNLTEHDMTYGVLLNDECDILFTHTLPSNENLLAYNIISINMNIYGTSSLIKAHPIKNINDYASAPCILFHSFMSQGGNIWRVQKNNVDIEIIVNGQYSCDNAYTALELAKSGIGYLYIPELLIKEASLQEVLYPTLPPDLHTRFTTYMIYKQRAYQPYRVEIVLDSIIDSLRQLS